jgi:hypothetical protein
MNSNQPIRSPFGDIATFNSPALDRMGAIWYQEEKERKNKALAAEKAEQNDYTEKLTNIRAADVDEYKDFHNKWSTARKEAIQLSKKGKPADYQKKIEESNILFAKLNRLVNASLEEKKNPNRQVSIKDRSDDYDEIDAVYKITPTSQLNKTYKTKSGREIVLADVEPLIYRPKLIDFNKSIKNALGKERAGSLEKNDLGNGKIMYKTPMFYNNAAEIADGLVSEMNTVRGGVREVEANLGFLEEQAPKIEAEFETYTNTPEYLKIYGEKPRFSPPKTRAENLIILAAKDAALKHKPRYLDGEEKFSEEQKLKQKKEADEVNFEQQKKLQKAGQDFTERMIWLKDGLKTPNEKIDNFYNGLGVSGESRKDLNNLEELAMLFSGKPLDISTKNSNKVMVGKTEYLDLTQNFQALGYQKSTSVKDPNDPNKVSTSKQDKNFKRIYYDPKSGNIIVAYQNVDDKNNNLKGVKLKNNQVIGVNKEGEGVSSNTSVILEGGKFKDARLRSNIIKNMAGALNLPPKAKDYLVKIVEQNIENNQSEQPTQQPKTKEAPKAKQGEKPKKETAEERAIRIASGG